MKAELLDSSLPACELGEGPHWDAASSMLYWVDIKGKRLHRFNPALRKHETFDTPSMIGFAIPSDKGSIVAGLQDGIYNFDMATGRFTPLVHPDYASADNRFNDGKCDRAGRLWCGTMNDKDHKQPSGAFYRYDSRGLHVQETGICISNGLGWSPDNKFMYYTDTVQRVIWRYDFDFASGTATNRRVFLEFPGKGRPDGLCIDSAGRILTAQWPGWCVEIYMPNGKLEDKIELPVPQVSSCCFGGRDLKTLYITTAHAGMSDEARIAAPLSGQVFALDISIPGLAETPFRSLP